MHIDASSFALGAVLQQDSGHGLQMVAFESRKLNNPKKRYSAYEWELLVVLHTCTTWRPYLGGRHFTLKTNHYSFEVYAYSAKVHWKNI